MKIKVLDTGGREYDLETLIGGKVDRLVIKAGGETYHLEESKDDCPLVQRDGGFSVHWQEGGEGAELRPNKGEPSTEFNLTVTGTSSTEWLDLTGSFTDMVEGFQS